MQELDPPERGADPGRAGGAAGRCGDAPAGQRHAGRRPAALGEPFRGPAPQHETGSSAALAGELQAPPGGFRHNADFAEHGGEHAAAQPLLHRPEDVAIPPAARQDKMLGCEPVGGEAGRIEVVGGQAPEDGTAATPRQAAKDAGGEGGGETAILLVPPGPQHLVQTGEHEPAAGQDGIHLRHAEGQASGRAAAAFDGADALAQNRQNLTHPASSD